MTHLVVPESVRAKGRVLLDPLVRAWLRIFPPRVPYPADFTTAEVELCKRVAPYTMTGPERIVALANVTRYVVANHIPGAIVECGVWRGGSMMAVAVTLLACGEATRDLYLFDTFEGMTAPDTVDRDGRGVAASDILASTLKREDFALRVADVSRYALSPANATFNMWCVASEEDVSANLSATGYPMDRVRLVRGSVEDTVPARAPNDISILRLDTDWYASTKHELEGLYERVVPGGVVIVDDYGHWQGARKAVDDFLRGLRRQPLLHRIDFTGRYWVKA